MKSIRVKNFRSYEDSGFIDLKPITLFVGLNSSGKSSFLRLFPLLRQSYEKKTSGPILWYGDYVDFDRFSTVINRHSKEKEIFFEFPLDLDYPDGTSRTVQIKLGVGSDHNDNTRLSCFSFKTDSCKIELHLDEQAGIILNGEEYQTINANELLDSESGLIPFAKYARLFRDNLTVCNVGGKTYFEIKTGIEESYAVNFSNPIKLVEQSGTRSVIYEIVQIIEPCFPSVSQIGSDFIPLGVSCMNFVEPDCLRQELESTFQGFSFEALDDSQKQKICSLLYLLNLQPVLEQIAQKVEKFCLSVRYIAPQRATAERYYRSQDLQVNEIDHRGDNLPMVLRSLSEQKKEDFEQWTKSNFGFVIRAFKEGGQYEVKVKTKKGDHFYNIVDMGFGYSQVVPIVTSLWFEINSKQADRPVLFAIEQPELHLHPGYQAMIANVLSKSVEVAKKSNLDLKFIVETHSETIVNRIGYNIEQGTIDSEDAAVYLFEKDMKDKLTTVKKSSFDENGYLQDWPYGFFEADL